MRVRVMNGNGTKDLGFGEYVGDVPVVAVAVGSGEELHLLSLHEPFNVPDPLPDGGQIIEIPDNPKIILDSGDTVYGCQVWWKRV
jgi:hypothetical protein